MHVFIAVLAVLVCAALFVPEASEARSYTGTWKSSDGAFIAVVKHDRIAMDIHVDDISGLYWEGSFKSKTNRIVSKANRRVLNDALFGSEEKTKLFVYRGGQLTFHFSINEVNKVISLRRTA